MGEAAAIGEWEAEVVKEEDVAATVVRWERFLPRAAMRVLLVESDDSTRQIIAALLRKCSYKVAAVGDGLKAWEILKGKSQSIDLILTEVDLPSISGFALLTLIMEHDICKNTPVIMMSSQDSVSTVYKCMLRGAADFLVKPVRINELRNLWQHVWRRQASSRNELRDEGVTQQKVSATAENNAVSTPSSDHSSVYVACVQRNKECIEKGSDAQSSCAKPDMDGEMVYGDSSNDLIHMKINSPEIDPNMRKAESCVKSNQRKHDSRDSGLVVAGSEDVNATLQEKEQATEGQREQTNVLCEAHNHNDAFVNSSREAIDFIGAFSDHFNCNFVSSGVTNNKFDSSPMLDLSLRRSHPSGSVNQVSDDRQVLSHSDASAFSRYINRVPQPLHSPSSTCNELRDHRNILDQQFSEHTFNYYDTHSSPLSSQKNMLSSATGHSRQTGVAFPGRQQTVVSIPLPVRGVKNDGLSPIYGSIVFPIACKQSELSPVPAKSPGSAHRQSNPETRNYQKGYNSMDQNFNNSARQAENYRRHKLDSSEDRRHLSSATDQSASSSFCNGNDCHLNSIGCGNNGSVYQTVVGGSVVESENQGSAVFGPNYQRNVQREAALNKFRLKRKERCFEKKVRYESRKKLAEQRPRVKGQFVRQMPASVETDSQCGNSVDG